MPESTVPLSKALECPECSHTGFVLFSNPILGGTLHKVQCKNEVCPWYETNWFVETDSNGEVQVNVEAMAKANSKRLIAKIDPTFDAHHEQVSRVLDRQLGEEIQGG